MIKTILEKAKPKPEAAYVMCHSEAGFTVNVPLDEFTAEDCILAYQWNAKDLTPDHGWPLRGLVPRLGPDVLPEKPAVNVPDAPAVER